MTKPGDVTPETPVEDIQFAIIVEQVRLDEEAAPDAEERGRIRKTFQKLRRIVPSRRRVMLAAVGLAWFSSATIDGLDIYEERLAAGDRGVPESVFIRYLTAPAIGAYQMLKQEALDRQEVILGHPDRTDSLRVILEERMKEIKDSLASPDQTRVDSAGPNDPDTSPPPPRP